LIALAVLIAFILLGTFLTLGEETVVEGKVFNETSMETIEGASVTIAYRITGPWWARM